MYILNFCRKIFNRKLYKSKVVKNGSFIRTFLLLISATLIYYFCSKIEIKSQKTIEICKTMSEEPIQKPDNPGIKVFGYSVKRGDSFSGILSNFGIPEKTSIDYYSHLKSIGCSVLYPKDSLILTIEDSNVVACSIFSRSQTWYDLHIRNDTIRVEERPMELTSYLCIIKGTITSSLFEEICKYREKPGLAIRFTDIFAWDINFFIDPREGDGFEILFEKQYINNHFVKYGHILAAKYTNRNKTYYAIANKNSEGNYNYFDLEGKSVQKKFLKAPLHFSRISSGYSYRRKHPILGIYRAHLGIDYAAPRGTPVYSAADGVVSFAGVKGGYGKHIRISHGSSYETYYGHLHKIKRDIKRGAHVKQGEKLGTVGSTGLATGPHLDYRMKRSSRFVNPLTISSPSKESVSFENMEYFKRVKNLYLSILENRFEQDGSYTVDIILPKNSCSMESRYLNFSEMIDSIHTAS